MDLALYSLHRLRLAEQVLIIMSLAVGRVNFCIQFHGCRIRLGLFDVCLQSVRYTLGHCVVNDIVRDFSFNRFFYCSTNFQ